MDCALILVTLASLLLAGYLYVKKKFQFWAGRGVPYVKPQFPFGILSGVGKTRQFSEILKGAYEELKGKDVFGGIYFFTNPVAVVTDLDLLKNVLVRDFQYFHDRGMYVNEKDDPLSGNLFALSGQRWKNMRSKLTPTFTSGKMKMMHSTIIAVAKEFQNYLEPLAEAKQEIEFKDIFARFTTDVIGSCAFGVECNSIKDPNTEFRRIGKRIFEFSPLEFVRVTFLTMFPGLGLKLGVSINKPEVTEFCMSLLRETTEHREKNNVERNDFLSLLMQIKNIGKLENDETDLGKISFEEMAAQIFLFFAAGYETSSSTMTMALYELALHQDIQDRARKEVNEILKKYNGEYTYEACMEMKYVDQIISGRLEFYIEVHEEFSHNFNVLFTETLRKYPILGSLMRVCAQNYPVPGTSHVIDKGTMVMIPIYGIHSNPKIYPEPEKFDPDRFTDENIKKRHPCAWIPFGEGPRNCVGMRFGMMQTRVGLAHLLSKYRVRTSPKTPIPFVLDPSNVVLSPKGGMWMIVEKA